jgi:hypothetical protein
MRDAAASRGRRVRHDCDRGALKKSGQLIFRNIAAKFYASVSGTLSPNGLRVTRGLRMVASGNHELGFGPLCRDQMEGINHEFEPLVGSPFAERQNAMDWSTTPREVREFGPTRQDAVRTQMHIIPSILVIQDLAIAGHQHRD